MEDVGNVEETMLPAIWHAARRRTVLVMYDPGDDQEIETMAVARYDVGQVFKKSWDKDFVTKSNPTFEF